MAQPGKSLGQREGRHSGQPYPEWASLPCNRTAKPKRKRRKSSGCASHVRFRLLLQRCGTRNLRRDPRLLSRGCRNAPSQPPPILLNRDKQSGPTTHSSYGAGQIRTDCRFPVKEGEEGSLTSLLLCSDGAGCSPFPSSTGSLLQCASTPSL